MKTVAKNHYINRKGNCAQSIAQAWSIKKNIDKNTDDIFVNSGGGKAVNGLCGALYAAIQIANTKNVKEMIINDFQQISSGYTKCKDIRKNKSLSCIDCVAVAADLLEKYNS